MTEPNNILAMFSRHEASRTDRTAAISNGTFKLGDWIVERDLNQLRCGERCVHVSSLAMDILAYLARPPGRVVASEELVRELWGGRIVADNPVYKIIAKLRRALRDDAEQPRYIETVRKRGYRLVAPVSEVEPAARCLPNVSTGRRNTNSRDRKVAVMPVCLIGSHNDQDCYCTGLAEELMVQFAKSNDLHVVAMTAESQDADLTIQATVRQSARRVRVTVRLVRSKDGVQTWAGAYERRAGDGVESQISIAREVAHAVRNTD